MRAGGVELRAVVGAAGVREFAEAVAVPVPGGFSFPVRVSFSPDEAEALFAFTKRCSLGSYTMEESLFRETTRVPERPSRTVLETRTGGVAGTTLLLSVSRGGDFKVSHFWPRSPAGSVSLRLRAEMGE